MSTIVIKVKKTNSIALFLIILIILWKVYGLYQNKIMGSNTNTYIYTKLISNVIPGTIAGEENNKTNIFNTILYGLTEIDLTNYRSVIEKNIPLMRRQVLLVDTEIYNTLIGFSKPSHKEDSKINEDYFDEKDELIITNIEDSTSPGKPIDIEWLKNDSYVTSKIINFDANLNLENQAMKQIDTVMLAEKEFKIKEGTGGPKVIIFHTHPHERFAGEEPSGGGVVDVGEYLKEILETRYGVETLHCTSKFEKTPSTVKKDDYGRMQIEIKQILEENPTIEVAIDLHRDGGSGDKKFLTSVNGKPTAKLMYVNGFSQVQKKGVLTAIESLPNPNFEDNLALSLQMHLKGNEKYPGLTRKNLIKPYRYSLHMKPMSLLVEVGNDNNTKEEALNSMDVFAELLMDVIEKD